MKTVLVASVILVAGAVASAQERPGMGIAPMKTVRDQVLSSAQNHGVWSGDRPELELRYNPKRTSVSASVSTMSRYTGGPSPLPMPVRMVQATARFGLEQTSEGVLASGIPQGGRIWQVILRASPSFGVRP